MVLTTDLLNGVTSSIITEIQAEMTHVAWGSDSTTPTVSDTALGSEDIRKARQETTSTANSVIISGFLGAGENNGNDVNESGTFDDPSAGNMKARNTSTTIEKTTSVEIWNDFSVTIDVQEV